VALIPTERNVEQQVRPVLDSAANITMCYLVILGHITRRAAEVVTNVAKDVAQMHR
jgi:hypothetical protein